MNPDMAAKECNVRFFTNSVGDVQDPMLVSYMDSTLKSLPGLAQAFQDIVQARYEATGDARADVSLEDKLAHARDYEASWSTTARIAEIEKAIEKPAGKAGDMDTTDEDAPPPAKPAAGESVVVSSDEDEAPVKRSRPQRRERAAPPTPDMLADSVHVTEELIQSLWRKVNALEQANSDLGDDVRELQRSNERLSSANEDLTTRVRHLEKTHVMSVRPDPRSSMPDAFEYDEDDQSHDEDENGEWVSSSRFPAAAGESSRMQLDAPTATGGAGFRAGAAPGERGFGGASRMELDAPVAAGGAGFGAGNRGDFGNRAVFGFGAGNRGDFGFGAGNRGAFGQASAGAAAGFSREAEDDELPRPAGRTFKRV
jgi:hypothetical protein